jgi:hypothetical protein
VIDVKAISKERDPCDDDHFPKGGVGTASRGRVGVAHGLGAVAPGGWSRGWD